MHSDKIPPCVTAYTPRYPVEYLAAFSGEGITASGVILNLSSGGCRVRSGGNHRQGDVLRLLIDVPRYQTLLEVNQVRVQWSSGDEFGLKFSGSPTEEDHRLLNELILAAQAAQTPRQDNRDESHQ